MTVNYEQTVRASLLAIAILWRRACFKYSQIEAHGFSHHVVASPKLSSSRQRGPVTPRPGKGARSPSPLLKYLTPDLPRVLDDLGALFCGVLVGIIIDWWNDSKNTRRLASSLLFNNNKCNRTLGAANLFPLSFLSYTFHDLGATASSPGPWISPRGSRLAPDFLQFCNISVICASVDFGRLTADRPAASALSHSRTGD